jgi:anti-sigma factor RsiW
VVERHVSGDRLSAFLDDELGDDDALRAARHTVDCERCLGEPAALRATRDALRALPSLQAPVLTAGVRTRSQQLARIGRRARQVGLACRVPVVIGVGVYGLGGDR